MVVCPQPIVAEVAANVLTSGGNAVDAAVTAALAQGVVDPQMCGIGGGGVMLVRSARASEVIAFYPRAGSRVRADQWATLTSRPTVDRYGYLIDGHVNDVGYESIAVPGTVRGLDHALRRHGTISWSDALRPAVELARAGVTVSGALSTSWTSQTNADLVPMRERIAFTPASRAIFTLDGAPLAAGALLVQTDLARTLERLAEAGPRDFYEGTLAREIAEDIGRGGGSFTADDLASYEPIISAPVRTEYRDLQVATVPVPGGGVTLAQMLRFVEGFDTRAVEADTVVVLVGAMEWAYRDRDRLIGDEGDATDVLLDRTRATEAQRAFTRRIDDGQAVQVDAGSTSHISVLDGAGMAVSLTHTLGSSSGVVSPGLGFSYNNYLNAFDPKPGSPNSLAPGKTRVTMMAPIILSDEDGAVLVAGAPGGTKIVGALLQTIVRIVDRRDSPVEAVSAPRVDFQGDVVEAEARVPSSWVRALERRGYAVHRRALSYDPYFAQPQVIAVGPDGPRGASDPRRDGGVALRVQIA